MTSAQKCFRTTDIDVVGDHKHLTFFEMLGNFSVGDYFKQGAIEFAWEFVTQRMQLPTEKLFITVYTDDDEAEGLWRVTAGTPPERMYRYGKSDNWWGPPGAEGPCGPCSEIHWDFGEASGCAPLSTPAEIAAWNASGMKPEEQPGCHPNCDRCERFVELWNLVFMQFYQDLEGAMSPLPKPNIDTGMGLERAAIIAQGVSNIYDTDLYQPIIGRVADLAGMRYGADLVTDVPMRVVAEHTRGAAFLISDGVIPGNEGRGYVLRRLIRRAVRFGRKLGLTEPFLTDVADVVIQRMGDAYPDLLQNRAFILRILEGEEQQFGRVMEQGLAIMEDVVAGLRENPNADALRFLTHSNPVFTLSVNNPESTIGLLAFILYDTYGFPVEETQEIAREQGFTVDMDEFNRLMAAQRERGRAATEARIGGGGEAKIFKYRDLGVGRVTFVGYDRLTAQTEVLALLTPEGDALSSAEPGQDVEVVLRETPFLRRGRRSDGRHGRHPFVARARRCI